MSGIRHIGVFMLAGGMALVGTAGAAKALDRHYASPVGEEQWTLSGNRLRCGLSLGIPNYGVAYFEQYATKDPHFILNKFQQVKRRLPARVSAQPPVWKPGDKAWFVVKTVVKPGKYGLYLKRNSSLKLLNYLANGLQGVFKYRSSQGFAVTVSLSPVNFQSVYRDYQSCVGKLLPFNYDDIKENLFHFGLEDYELNEQDKRQLRRIALYSQVDDKVDAIRVSGYTDDTGRKSYNNAISEMRANAVANYLRRSGVADKLLKVTWFGLENPIASNETEEGRATNRRVLVEVLHKNR